MALGPMLTDRQWEKIEPLMPKLHRRADKRGRPWMDDRRCMEGILWVLRTGAQWQALPEQYPAPVTCWRRLKLWEEMGVWEKVWRAFLGELDGRGRLDWKEAFIDGSFASAKKGALLWEKRSEGKGQSGWWWRTGRGVLWAPTWLRPRQRR